MRSDTVTLRCAICQPPADVVASVDWQLINGISNVSEPAPDVGKPWRCLSHAVRTAKRGCVATAGNVYEASAEVGGVDGRNSSGNGDRTTPNV